MGLTRTDLVSAVKKRLDLSEKQSEQVVAAILASITGALAGGEEVRIAEFGKFFLKHRGGRIYHSPVDGAPVERGPQKVVRFKAFARLNEKMAAKEVDELELLTIGAVSDERRRNRRVDLPDIGSAIIRISGIPVCEFKIKDISDGGSALWVEEDAVMLRNIRVGQEIDIRINHRASVQGPVLQRARVVHISKTDRPDRQGYYVLGVQILGKVAM